MARATVHNTIVNEEDWKLVNLDNKYLLNEFIEYCESTDKSALTVLNYKSDIRICFTWNLHSNDNMSFIDFTKRTFMKYQNYMLNTLNLSPNRIRRLRSSLSSMANFIENMLDDIPKYQHYRNIVNRVPAPNKEEVREKTILSDEQVQLLLDYLVEHKQYAKSCALALAWASGSRKSEILRLKISFFTDDNIIYGSLYKTPEKIKTKGRSRKLGKQLNKYIIVDKFKPYFDLWMKQRKELEIDDKSLDDVLFVSKRKEVWSPMKISTLDSWADAFTKFLGVDFYFHCLRHNFCTGLSKANIPALVIKEIVGWESVEMVNLYDDTNVDDKLSDYFDENGIKKIKKKTLEDL